MDSWRFSDENKLKHDVIPIIFNDIAVESFIHFFK